MAKVNYVACPACHRDYYIEKMLSKALEADPALMLKCPFCKSDFNLAKKSDVQRPAKAGQ